MYLVLPELICNTIIYKDFQKYKVRIKSFVLLLFLKERQTHTLQPYNSLIVIVLIIVLT